MPINKTMTDSERGKDFLGFICLSKETFDETFRRHEKGCQHLLKTDSLWADLLQCQVPVKDKVMSSVFAIQGHSLFRASLANAFSGHVAPIYPLLRNALECCFYGIIISEQPELMDVWIDRHGSLSSFKKCREKFTASRALKLLKKTDANLGAFAQEAYDSTIDFGAHPNVKGVVNHITVNELENYHQLQITYLHGSGFETSRGLVACSEIGLCMLFIMIYLLPERSSEIKMIELANEHFLDFSPELFGVSSAIRDQ